MSWRLGMAYAQDLRDRVLAAPGLLREVAERFDVSQSYVSRVRARRQRLCQTRAGVQCNHVPPRLAALKVALLAQVALAPEQTLVQLCQWVLAEHGTRVSPTTMGKTLARLGLTLKKDALCQRAAAPRCRPGAKGLESRTTLDGRRTADISR